VKGELDDLVLVTQALLQKYGKDPSLAFKPFDEENYERGQASKLTVAYIDETPNCEVFPAIKNVLLETIAELKSRGYKVLALPYPELDNLNDVMFDLFMTMGSIPLSTALADEEPAAFNKWRMKLHSFPKPLLPLLYKYYILKGEKRLSQTAWRYRPKSLMEFFELAKQKEMLKLQFLKVWVEKQIDVLLMPAFPTTALYDNDSEKLLSLLPFNTVTNVVDMPAGFVPIRRVKAEEELMNSRFQDSISKTYEKNITGSRGLPVGLQVAAMSFEDELCLGFMKQLENIFKFHELPPAAETQ